MFKRLRKNKYFKMGFTLLIVAMISISFNYLLNNGSKVFVFNVNKFFNVLMPFIYGFVIAYLLWPIVNFLETKIIKKYYDHKKIAIKPKDKKRFRVICVFFSLIFVIYLLYLFFMNVLPELFTSIESIINNFPTYYDNVITQIDKFLTNTDFIPIKNIDEAFDSVSEFLENLTENTILPNLKEYAVNIYSGVVNLVNTIMDILIGLIMAIYLLISKEKFIGQAKKVIYSLCNKTKANNLIMDLRFINDTFGGFLIGKIIDSIIIGILCFILLLLAKMPYALLVSVIIGVTNIIPFFGPLLGAIPSAFLILLVDPKKCLVFLIIILALQQLDGNIIGPAILGNSIGISSFWIIVAITIFSGYFGFTGMLIGVPVFAIIYAFIRRNINNRLIKKDLTLNSSEYIELDHIDDDERFVTFDEMNEDNEYTKNYIKLSMNSEQDGLNDGSEDSEKSLKSRLIRFIQKIKEKFHKNN
ncbi:MAG: AI-2E family transporter [Lachnospiraceae bacterium]|nr:AI-2E family transporter [Lachnospiraceae bacterium]